MESPEAMIIFVRETLGLPSSVKIDLEPFSDRGSDRRYIRVKWNREHSLVLMHYNPARTENTLFADIATFLHEIDIPVPQVLRHDATRCLILMQDLGDTDLWSLRGKRWETLKSYYFRTLDIAHRLHTFPLPRFPSNRVKLMEPFSPSLYRWEHHYFNERFIMGLCGIEIEPQSLQVLDCEMAGLVNGLMSHRQSLVHRDLQSQNVLICDEEPFLIDFQGMRFGTPFYDLGSLLCDPYTDLSETEREELLMHYYWLCKEEIDWNDFQSAFWAASAQRLMQALGAYAFLGLSKGLHGYLAHVPAGLKNLRLALQKAGSFPRLHELCLRCEKSLAA